MRRAQKAGVRNSGIVTRHVLAVRPWHFAHKGWPLYLEVQLPLLLFRFVVLVTVHLYDPL